MKSPFGFGLLAVMTTASLALAQGSGSGGDSTTTTSFQEMDMISMAPGEGITFDMGDEFMLNLRTLVQFSYTYASLDVKPGGVSPATGQNYNNFNVDRARTYLTGHLFDPSIEYQMSLEWTDGASATGSPLGDAIRPAGGSVLKDANVTWMFWENEDSELGLRAGQSKTGFGRQGTTWEGAYEFAYGRQVATRTFGALRTRGAWVGGNHMDGNLHWHAGVQNGDVAGGATGIAEYGEETANPDTELSYLFVVAYDTAEDLGGEWGTEGDMGHREEVDWGVGGAIFFGNNRAAGEDVESTSYNVNAVVKTQGFAAAGEYFDREDDPQVAGGVEEDADGYQVQVSYTTAPASTQYGFVLGYSAVDLEGSGGGVTYMTGTPLGGTAGTVQELSVGVDLYYHENSLKTTFAYVAQNVDPDGATDVDNNIIVIQMQIVF